jgi:hypothetical protein
VGRTYAPPLLRDHIDTPMLTRVWKELEYRIAVCRFTRGANIENL